MSKQFTLEDLLAAINDTEHLLSTELLRFWRLVKIEPEKWKEKGYGNDSGGFWVVALCGNKVVWYNDVEQGFNISMYTDHGEISEYWCNEYGFNQVIYQLYHNC